LGHDQRDLLPDELVGDNGELRSIFVTTIVDSYVLPVDLAEVAQTLAKRLETGRGLALRRKVRDPRTLMTLCASASCAAVKIVEDEISYA
jgi:hypothetical protein